MKKSMSLALMASALPLLFAAGAHAQSYTRLVSFGDSLSDNGNLYTGTMGTQPPAPYNHRFTNDKVWAEYLSGSMQGWFTATSYTTGNLDLAWGGARTDNASNSSGPIPGTPTQIGYFQLHGGSFGAGDVASMWAGANDIFQALPGAAGNPSTAASVMTGVSATAGGNVATQVGQLASLGAPTILVMNLPDLGKTPQFSSDPNASALTTLSATVFNTALDTGLKAQATAHSGTNIIQVDIYSAFNAIIANPQAFGFTNVTQECIQVTSCVTGSLDAQNSYLFWDGVHPTEGGHKLVAKVTAQYLYTPTLTEGVGMFADEAYNTRRANLADLADLMHASRAGNGGYFAQAVGAEGSRTTDIALQSQIGTAATLSDQKAYDYQLAGIRAGAVQSLGDGTTYGFGVTALTGTGKAFMVEAKPTDISVDAGMEWRPGSWFIGAGVGAGATSYSDYKRQTLIGAFQEHLNHVDATSYSASLQAGMDSDMGGGWTITPLARLSYTGASMKGFDEIGPIASVAFDNRKVSATSGAVELHASGKLGDHTALTGLLGYEAVLSGDEGDLKGKLINNTAQAFATDMGDVKSPGLMVGVGLSTDFGGFSVGAQYRGTFGSHDQKDQTATISLTKAF